MKKLILIWVGVIVGVLLIGIIAGKIGQSTGGGTEPTIPQEEVVVGYDKDGNPITEMVDQDEEVIKIDGQKFKINTGAFADKKFKLEGVEFGFKFSIDDLLNNGFTQQNTTMFVKNNSTIKINFNPSKRLALSVSAYSESYGTVSNLNVQYCENLELPSGIVLGKSTLEDVQRVYGTSIVYNGDIKTTKYYADAKKTSGFMVLYFDNDDVLCGLDIGCNIFGD